MAPGRERFPNLVTMFLARAAEKGDAPFLWRKSEGEWRSQSWAETARQVAALAQGLRAIGLAPGDRVLLVSENRPEWCVADLAIMAAGCVTVPAYTSNTQADHAHVLADSGAQAAIVSTAKLAAPLLAAIRAAPGCAHVVAVEAVAADPADRFALHDFATLAGGDGDIAACAAAAGFARGDLACLIYTSGTGGAPRGVMHHHGAILHNVAGAAAIISEDFVAGDEEVFLSFLPLSHAYEHSAGQYLAIGLGAQIYYAEGLDKLAANIAEVRPTIMIVVPRLFELLRQRIVRAVEKQGRAARWLLGRALAVAAQRAGRRRRDAPWRLLIRRTLAPKVAAQFGGRLKAMVSGGAPLNPEVGAFFETIGLTLLQGYGQTESGPIIACNRPRAGIAMDTVGPPLADTEVAIADDGEILVRGELVMHGYWRDPQASAAALAGGWLHTGDVGRFDAAGRLTITDRKKDIIVSDKGDNVSPQRIEGMLTMRPEILQAMVVGDRRPWLAALIVPDPDWIAAAGLAGDAEAVARALQPAIDAVNKGLSTIEKVRRFAVADEPFAVANAQMTPSLKIRRHVIREAYGERLDGLYAAV